MDVSYYIEAKTFYYHTTLSLFYVVNERKCKDCVILSTSNCSFEMYYNNTSLFPVH